MNGRRPDTDPTTSVHPRVNGAADPRVVVTRPFSGEKSELTWNVLQQVPGNGYTWLVLMLATAAAGALARARDGAAREVAHARAVSAPGRLSRPAPAPAP